MKKINNYVNKIKLIVTTDCNMKCSYCMVKNTREYMSLDIAIKTVEYFIFNNLDNWQKKFIYFFWWEPLLNFNLIKDVISYINKKYKKSNLLEFVICSNFTFVKKEILDFIIDNNIKLSISIWWKNNQHNSHRIFSKVKSNALDLTLENIEKLKKRLNLYNIWVWFVLIKENIKNMFNNFIYIVEDIGLLHINFEIILDKKEWTKKDYIIFKKEYYKIIRYILNNIRKWKYIYLNNLNWTILLLLNIINEDNKTKQYLTEIYPNWDILYSSFYSNLDDNIKQDLLVWNINLWEINTKISLKDYFNKFNLLDNFNGWEWYKLISYFLKDINNYFWKFIIKESKLNSNYLTYLWKIKDIYF